MQFLSSPLILRDVMATDAFEHLARSCPSVLKDLMFNVPTRAPVGPEEKSQVDVDMGRHGMFSSGRRTKYCYRVLVLLVLLLVLSLKGTKYSSWMQLLTEKTSYYLVSKK